MGTEMARASIHWGWAGLSIVCASLLVLELASSDSDGGMITEAVHGGLDKAGIGRLVSQFDNNMWDPQDPDHFKKIIRLVVALGLSLGTVAGIVRAQERDVDAWRGGRAPKEHPWAVIGRLMRTLRRMAK